MITMFISPLLPGSGQIFVAGTNKYYNYYFNISTHLTVVQMGMTSDMTIKELYGT
jgi:hypothetical protein